MKIKICGIYREEDIAIVNEARPDYFGMVLNFPKSHRSVTQEEALRLRAGIDRKIPAVGVTVDLPMEELIALAASGCIDILQLHGHENPEMIRELREKTGKPVWKAFKIRSEADLREAVESPADKILLDNGYGTGETFDWTMVGTIDRPFILAGGIREDNIYKAFEMMRPEMFDISSGVETDKKKDREKVIRIVENVRRMV